MPLPSGLESLIDIFEEASRRIACSRHPLSIPPGRLGVLADLRDSLLRKKQEKLLVGNLALGIPRRLPTQGVWRWGFLGSCNVWRSRVEFRRISLYTLRIEIFLIPIHHH